MKSLKESILSSNNAGIISQIKNIMLSPSSEDMEGKLNHLWKILGLDMKGFFWRDWLWSYSYVSDERDGYEWMKVDRNKEKIIIIKRDKDFSLSPKDIYEYVKKTSKILGWPLTEDKKYYIITIKK